MINGRSDISPYRLPLLAAILLALAAMIFAGSAQAAAHGQKKPHQQRPHCKRGYKVVPKTVRRHGKRMIVRHCKKVKKRSHPKHPAAPAPSSPPSSNPSHTEPTVTGPTVLHVEIDPKYAQNPASLGEVTWIYSASATRTLAADGKVVGTAPVPLPPGILAFAVDGVHRCTAAVGGSVTSSTCEATFENTGAHQLTATFTSGAESVETSQSAEITPLPTTTVGHATYQAGPPIWTWAEGVNEAEEPVWDFGSVTLSSTVSPAGLATPNCNGGGPDCIAPRPNFGSPATYRLYGKWQSYYGKWIWEFRIAGTEPFGRPEGPWYRLAEAESGELFFQFIGGWGEQQEFLKTSLDRAPLAFDSVHLPFRDEFTDETSILPEGAENAVPIATLGGYDKVGNAIETELWGRGLFDVHPDDPNCVYEVRVDGRKGTQEPIFGSEPPSYRFAGIEQQLLPVEYWGYRKAGSGEGECHFRRAVVEAFEARP